MSGNINIPSALPEVEVPSSFTPLPVRPEITTEMIEHECDRIQRKIDILKADFATDHPLQLEDRSQQNG